MKRIVGLIFVLFLCLGFPCGNVALAEESPVFVVSANIAPIYADANLGAEVLVTLAHGTELSGEYQLEFSSSSPAVYENAGLVFYKILFDETEGYILSDFVVQKSEVVESIPNFNAKTNSSCTVYCADGEELTLEKGHRIYLYEKYNSHAPRTNIMFLYENKILYGQIETKFVDPDGVNPVLISAIIIIVAILGIIFAWLFMKNKKKKVKINKK